MRPRVTVALGATGARAVLGRTTTVGKSRGKLITLNDGVAIVTIHPSWLLRIREEAIRTKEFKALVRDLIIARTAAGQA